MNGAIRWCADGKLAAVGLDGSYHLMDVTNKKVERTQFPQSELTHWCATLSPDGRLVAIVSLSDNTRITLFDAWAGKRLQVLEGHSRQVERLAFSSDGKLLASINAAEGIQLKLWKAGPTSDVNDSK